MKKQSVKDKPDDRGLGLQVWENRGMSGAYSVIDQALRQIKAQNSWTLVPKGVLTALRQCDGQFCPDTVKVCGTEAGSAAILATSEGFVMFSAEFCATSGRWHIYRRNGVHLEKPQEFVPEYPTK